MVSFVTILLSLVVLSLSQPPSGCPPWQSPISNYTLGKLLGPGGVGPVVLGNVTFGAAWRSCNGISGCTPWKNAYDYTVTSPYATSTSYTYGFTTCNSGGLVDSFNLKLASGVPYVWLTTSSGTSNSGAPVSGVGSRTVSISSTAAYSYYGSSCSSTGFVYFGTSNTKFYSVGMNGVITDTCISLVSPIYNITDPTTGAVISGQYWLSGSVGASSSVKIQKK